MIETSNARPVVMVSSTALDLPERRKVIGTPVSYKDAWFTILLSALSESRSI